MRKDFGPQTWFYPMPVLIIGTYDENGIPNAMTAAWGGIHDTLQLGVCIDPSHKTAKNLLIKQAFTVSFGDATHVVECDYLGLVSGNDTINKLEKSGFHTHKSEYVDAPVIDELPMVLECRLVSYDQTTGCTVGEMVNVSIDEQILDNAGKVDLSKFEPISFDPVNQLYRRLGEVAGKAFEVGGKLV